MKAIKARFYHFRIIKQDEVKPNEFNLSTTGGVTVCAIEKNGSTLVGISVCSHEDTYHKKYGRMRSQGLAMSTNKFKKIDSTDRNVVLNIIKDMAKFAWFSVLDRGNRLAEFGDKHKIILSGKQRTSKKKEVVSYVSKSTTSV